MPLVIVVVPTVIPPHPLTVWNVGNAPAPLEVSTCHDVPTDAIDCNAHVLVVHPHKTAYAVVLASQVHPLGTDSWLVHQRVCIVPVLVIVTLVSLKNVCDAQLSQFREVIAFTR